LKLENTELGLTRDVEWYKIVLKWDQAVLS